MKMTPVSLAALALLSGLAIGTASAASRPALDSVVQAPDGRSTYIVQLVDEPVASYTGTIAGYPATKPQAGARTAFSATAAATSYATYLRSKQDAVVASVGTAQVLYRYDTVVNGFAVRLTDAQARQLMANPAVKNIEAEQQYHADTITSPTFLGLTAQGGVWSQNVNGTAIKGEDIVIGVIDLGISPENPAFADHVDINGNPTFNGGTLAYGPKPVTYTGACQDGEGFVAATSCNNKLIGAQFFNTAFKTFLATQPTTADWTTFASPRDDLSTPPTGHGGHGDHTSSTAGGNSGNPALIAGAVLGQASGVAPRARIASYKICYTYADSTATDGSGTSNSCFGGDIIAAIDQAVKDGVNVINFSISGTQTSLNDAAEQAFLRASNAGVFVSASAGNSGPTNTVAHPSPWLTTVAASTQSRIFSADVFLGDGTKYTGASVDQTALPSAPIIRAEDAGIAGASANLKLCYSSPLELDPAKVAGKIVVCTRGTNARVDKSLAVLNAGGVGMVLADNGSGLVAEAHSVPTVHVSQADGNTIKTYAAAQANSPTASFTAFYYGTKPAPIMASFSSRGPNKADPNVQKPDVTAPGVDIIAAVSSSITQNQKAQLLAGTFTPPPAYASYQGTSMAAPHVAGLGALLKQAHPTWSPAAIKSAIMTTTYSTLDDGLTGMQSGLLPWAQGSGHIQPNKAIDPGLVYDAGPDDWTKYQCKVNKAGISDATLCTTVGTLDQTYNLNYPSITIGAATGPTNITRRVTNVGTAAATYTGTITLPGWTASIAPSSLTLNPGETKSFVVSITPTTAAKNVYQYGSMTWTDGTHKVVSPVTVALGAQIAPPALLTATTASGTRLVTVNTGYAGKMTGAKGGLKDVTMSQPATLTPNPLTAANFLAACKTGVSTASMKVYSFTVPADAIVAKFALRQADVSGAADDNDLTVLAPDNTTNWASTTNGSNESISISQPPAGTYRACVLAWGGSPSMTHSLSSWIVAKGDTPTAGAFNVMVPTTVYSGGTATVGFAWSGLANGGRYLGGELFYDATNTATAATVVQVDVAAVPTTSSPRPEAAPGQIGKVAAGN